MTKPKKSNSDLDEYGVILLCSFLAECLDASDRRPEMLAPVPISSIPEDMAIHRKLLQAVYHYWEKGLKSTDDNIAAFMNAYEDIKDSWESVVTHIKSLKNDYGNVANPAAQWLTYQDQRQIVVVAEELLVLAKNPGGKFLHEIVEQTQKQLADISTGATRITVVDVEGAGKILDKVQSRKYEAYLAGKSLSPVMPWGLDRFIILNPGDPIMISALPKMGKTTCAQYLGERFQEQGYYVISIEKETALQVMQKRRMARWFGVPSKAFDGSILTPFTHQPMPPVNRKAPQWGRLYAAYDDELKRRRGVGRFVHINGAGQTPESILGRAATHRKHAEELGMEVVVIDDYLQKTDTDHYGRGEYQGISRAAEVLKNGIYNMQVYAVIFAQEIEKTNQHTGQVRQEAFGSAKVGQLTQGHLSLKRKKAEINEPVIEFQDQNTVNLTNGIGATRYYGRDDWELSGYGEIRVLRNNEGRGGSVKVRFEPALYLIYSENEKPKQFEQMIND